MKLRVLGHTAGACRGFPSTAALVDDDILLDAGTGASALYGAEMARVSDLLLTHSHLDHVAMMCFVADYRQREGLTAHCLPETAEAIRTGILNGAIWPRMDRIKVDGKPLISFSKIEPFKTFEIRGRRFTPLPAEHTTPTVGFCLHGGARKPGLVLGHMRRGAAGCGSGLKDLKNFKRVVLEASFPEEDHELAKMSGHLTPKTLEDMLKKNAVRLAGVLRPRQAARGQCGGRAVARPLWRPGHPAGGRGRSLTSDPRARPPPEKPARRRNSPRGKTPAGRWFNGVAGD